MSALARIIRVLFVALSCTTASALAAPDQECGERASLAELIANPDAYHGKIVWVVAFATIDFENMTACPSEDETQASKCLWLDLDDGPYKTDEDYARYQSKRKAWEKFNLQTVGIRATFDRSSKGHFSMWPGGLRTITEVSGHQDGWTFTTNTAVPRTACVGKLPVPRLPTASSGWIGAGNLKLRDRDYDGAIADFGRAISLEPSNSGYYLLRANAKERKRDYAGAIADYTHAIEFAREDRDVIHVIRAEAREQAGDLDGAIADYTRAIEIDPTVYGNYNLRGLAKQKKGDTKGAAADFARARRSAPAQSRP